MHVEQSTLNEVSTDNLNMNHLEARFQNVFIDLEVWFMCSFLPFSLQLFIVGFFNAFFI